MTPAVEIVGISPSRSHLLATSFSRKRERATRRLPAEPRFVCLGHSLKETLGASMVCRSLELGVQLAGGRVASNCCISDGGDGFLDAYAAVFRLRRYRFVCPGPMGGIAVSDLLYEDDTSTAVIESAHTVGMRLVPPDKRDIMASSTAGLGVLISKALSMGARRLIIGLGGSATCDGGLGMLGRLEEELLEVTQRGHGFAARDLDHFPSIRLRELRERLAPVAMAVFCDVSSPLLGSEGTAEKFAPQKGATPEQVRDLELWMESWADFAEDRTEPGLRARPGAGAAGGLGFALAVLGARLVPGASMFCDLIGLDGRLKKADGLVTAEGRFDRTSFSGKAPWVAARRAVDQGKFALIACGSADEEAAEEAYSQGVCVVPFAENLPVERRMAESFGRLQSAVRWYIG